MNRGILLIFLIISHVASAQNKIHFDLHGGSGLSYLKGYNTGSSSRTDPKLAITAGVGIVIPVSRSWFIQPEVNYQNIGGGRDKSSIIYLQNYEKYILQYVSLPLLFKFRLPNSGLGIYAGPQYSYLLSNKLETSRDTYEESNRLRKGHFSGVLGAEYYFPLNDGNQIGLSGRYQFLGKIDKNHSKDLYIGNEVLLITLGFRF